MVKISMEAARVNAGFTQQELADKMGVSRSTVVNMEKGHSEVRPLYLYAFCHIVGLPVDNISLPKTSTENGLAETEERDAE